jgi:uncharacterized protein YjbJ (UPF0337 family)
MNKDKISGKVNQVTGRIKESVGETVGNQKLANEGVVDQAKGAAKETWGNAKDAAKDSAQRHQEQTEERANEARSKVRTTVQDVRDKINEKIDARNRDDRQRTA